LGADDYIVKPFSPREVVARVRAVMRRVAGETDAPENGQALRVRNLEIDERAHEVRIAGSEIAVTPAEFKILHVLAQNAGQTLTRAQLLDLVNDDGSIFERTLDRHINNLRRKIEPNPDDPEYIVTVYGVGYKLRKD
jgi:two-component system alkaline phosphatase synthesis response regulator PhoP